MGRDHQHFNLRTRLAIENVVRETRHSIPPDSRGKFDAKPVWILTNRDHRGLECREIPCAQSSALILVVGNMFKVLNARLSTEEITHFSKA